MRSQSPCDRRQYLLNGDALRTAMAKILFLEDEKALADIVLDVLKAHDYMVDHVGLAAEAKVRLRVYQYDLVILDVNLPDGNGVDVCKDFRGGGGVTPVLMLTGRSQVQEKALGLDAG